MFMIIMFQWGNNVFNYFMRWLESCSQEEYSPEDPANPCVNYPTEEYESYADCDDHFVRSSLPPGLKPFWTVDNISEATNTFYLDEDSDYYDLSNNLGKGYSTS